ncbi:ATP-binding protein [Fictibacillus sp. FJAT-27399]|uniref:ATP-binding protein n=1 Tax=Fictibacillus sp. FJAT-27399 TaxID=1729689 RepID=UPI000784BDBE|nr:ATP-binding protein [Fictibacillus sp. FJAT-27399]
MKTSNTDHVFGYVLEVLTTGLYPNNLDIIREYIQNGYDAIKNLRELGVRGTEEIRIKIENNSIIIHDTGIGMDRNTVEKYRYFGYSEKITTKNTGFRGIGKLAGLSVANDLEVITTKYGVPYQYKIMFSASRMLKKVIEGKKVGENYPLNELIKEHTIIEEYPEQSNSHYTQVILHDIKEDANDLLNIERVQNYIAEVMPIEFQKEQFTLGSIISEKLVDNLTDYKTIEIFLNNKKIFKPYSNSDGLSGLRFFEVFDEESSNQKLLAYGWVTKNGNNSKAIQNDLVKNVRLFYKGFRIGSNDLITNALFSSGRQFLSSWFAGEIYVFDEELIPTSARDNFESNSARKKLYQNLREKIGKNLDKIANQTSQNNSVHKEIDKSNKLLESINNLKELIPMEVVSLKKKEIEERVSTLEKKINNNKNNLTGETEKKAKEVLVNLKKQKKAIKDLEQNKEEYVEINFSQKEKQVYDIMIKSIKTFFKKNKLENEEELLSYAYSKLEKVFGIKKLK